MLYLGTLQLPLYGEPSSAELVYIPEKPGWLQQNMEPLRDFVMTGVAHSQVKTLIMFLRHLQLCTSL